MKILILTPINPVHAADVYSKLSNHFNNEKRKINFICYPFFAEMEAMKNDKEFLPTFFAMINAAESPKIKSKLYNRKRTVVIGNTYKTDKFDSIISFNDLDDEVFDKYLEVLNNDEEVEKIKEKLRLDEMYKVEDAELNLPTVDHLILFLESMFFSKKEEQKAS